MNTDQRMYVRALLLCLMLKIQLSLHKLRAAIEYARDDVSSAAKELQAAEDHGDPDVQVRAFLISTLLLNNYK